MQRELEKAQGIFLSRINQMCGKFGLNNIMAQLYAVLYLSDKPLSLNDMAERLKISKGSASINIRALERYGAVRQVWVKGSRRDYYEAEADIAKVVMDRIRSMVQSRLSEIDDMLKASYTVLDSISLADQDDGSARLFKQRLDRLQGLKDKANGLFDLLKSGLVTEVLSDAGR